ncbi:MAG: Rpn family recombination-promoting nuclease/putative transposase [Defluviitaleaceae bacterium]|nr:Rpn family recombination-promoting nuclease/putative transposase [Defluviitaleaceae bacterium]
MATLHKAKDNSVKAILSEHELFAEFLKSFLPLEILSDVSSSDIEDVTERLISLISEQKDGDTIKRVNLKGNTPLFVITIVEHESKVNFRAPFKMLLYIALILDAYEKEVNKDTPVTHTKNFKYPPIIPIIFYDGDDEWTAEMNFLHRTEMSDVFEKYIPKFEYELIKLKKYSFEDLAKFNNIVSLFMMIDKLKSSEAFYELGSLPKEQLDAINIPRHLKELLVKVFTVLLTRIDVPQDEIKNFMEKIDERGVSEMIAAGVYSVQETRRETREEVTREYEPRLSAAIKALIDTGRTISEIAALMNMSENDVRGLVPN